MMLYMLTFPRGSEAGWMMNFINRKRATWKQSGYMATSYAERWNGKNK
jgi:hypothetical protein